MLKSFLTKLYHQKSSLIIRLFKATIAVVVFLIALFFGLYIFLTVLDFAEDEDHEQQLDKEFVEMDNKEKLSIDNILVGTSIPSSIRRHSPKGVSYYMKNFNDATFEGVFKVQAIYDGIVIVSEHVHEITLEGDEFFPIISLRRNLIMKNLMSADRGKQLI